jgi:hypothetical protein
MAFVKLDCGILNSTLWIDSDARTIFITALLMADPFEVAKPMPQIEVRTLENTGFEVPVGWYGFVCAAGVGIVRRAGLDPDNGLSALERLGSPEPESRTPLFEGRRLVRVDGGYLILNYDKYRQKDHTAAERQARFRAKKAEERRYGVTTTRNAVIARDVTHSEAEAEAEKTKREASPPRPLFEPPTSEESMREAEACGLPRSEGQSFVDHHQTRGWLLRGGQKMKDWRAGMRTWAKNYRAFANEKNGAAKPKIPTAFERDVSRAKACLLDWANTAEDKHKSTYAFLATLSDSAIQAYFTADEQTTIKTILP